MNVKVDTRIPEEQRDAIIEIAKRLYDGNFSMAFRKVIRDGLEVNNMPYSITIKCDKDFNIDDLYDDTNPKTTN